jgi:hypothetical protein
MSIDSQEIALMRELVDVQSARAANWPTPYGPTNKDLETVHRQRISSIKKRLSDRRVSEPENTPAAVPQSFTKPEGMGNPRRATFFSRLMRMVRNAHAQTPATGASADTHTNHTNT